MCPGPFQAHASLIASRIGIIANSRATDGLISPNVGSTRILKARKKIYQLRAKTP